MKEYRLEVKIKNNLLYQAMIENGIETASALSRCTGVFPSEIGKYLGLTTSPINAKTGKLKKSYTDICNFLKRLPEDLYPKQHMTEPLRKNKSSAEASFEEISGYLAPPLSPEEAILIEDRNKVLREALSQLTPRQKNIIEQRFGLGEHEPKTLAEVGKAHNISPERVRSIESQALRILKNPKHTKKMRPYAGL